MKKQSKPVTVGVIGCGVISEIYMQNLTGIFRKGVRVVACADLMPERARALAAGYPGVRAMTVEELLVDPGIELAVNLTIPAAHAAVSRRCLVAGKHVYSEKPLAQSRADADGLLRLAANKRLRVGCAPDTFLGSGIQTCLRLVRSGAIGRPVAATGFMLSHGPERWHPSPEFLFQPGGGPMFDMGPYYLTMLTALLGPVERVAGMNSTAFARRTIGMGPRLGESFRVSVPTHVTGLLRFRSGSVGTMITSFDIWGTRLPCVEIHGTEGSINFWDPNCFGGPVSLKTGRMKKWKDVPIPAVYSENSRGLGVADMAAALRSGRPHRASGELGRHVLDLMHAFHDAAAAGREVRVKSTCRVPAPMPERLRAGQVDR